MSWMVALDQTFKIERQWVDENGYLHVWGQAAVAGSMDYPEHGFRAYVPPEVLKESVDGLVAKPITREHPEKGLIKPESAKDNVLGTVLEASFDESKNRVLFHAVVYDAELKAEIQTKRRYQVSPGYKTQFLDLKKPTADGATKYQATRVYNHLAFVEAARGGESCAAFDSVPPTSPLESKMNGTDKEEDKKNQDPANPPQKAFDADAFRQEQDTKFANMQKSIDALADLIKGRKSEEDPKKKEDEDQDEEESMDSKQLFARMKVAQSVIAKHGLDVADSDDIKAFEAAVAKAYTGKDVPEGQVAGVLFAADAAPAKTDSEKTKEKFKLGKKETDAQDSKADDLPPAQDWHLSSLRVK